MGVERAALPGFNIFQHTVRNRTHVLCTDANAVLFFQEGADVTGRHAASVHGDDLVIESGKLTGVLGKQNGRESALSIARYVDFDRPDVSIDCLAADTVALVALATRTGNLFGLLVAAFCSTRRNTAQMSLHLPLKGRFHEALHDHMGEALGTLHPVEQARGHSLINRRPEFRELVNVDAVRLVLTFGVFRRSHHG